ncbi:MAG: hypothetical protein J1E65_04345 [Lachnospiraceae bacterium]|nr:hypothetical protein [Lachnospiraceae bacterium]
MNIEEPLMGFAEYKDKEFPFLYEDGILKLMPSSIKEWKEERSRLLFNMTQWGKKEKESWIGYSAISARAHNGNKLIFVVKNDSSNNNGFISFSVIYFFEYDAEISDPEHIWGISVTGLEVDDFYNPARVFEAEMEWVDNKFKSTKVSAGVGEEIEIGNYLYKDCELKMIVSANPSYHTSSETPLSAKSKIKVVFSKEQNLEYAVDVYFHLKKLFFYLCGRTNISLDDIQVYGKEEEKFYNDGAIRICENKVCAESNMKRSKRIIKYEYVQNGLSSILQAVADEKMYFENLCDSIENTYTYSIDRIILNFVAFEREFRNLYSEEMERSEEYNEVKDAVLKSLEELKDKYTGKKRKYVKNFISSFGKSENKYADRMAKALADCEEILYPFLSHDYSDYNSEMIEDIADRMNALRNDSAHGNIDLEIQPIHISDFATLENLLYAMRLKHAGVDLTDIRKGIRDLKNYNIMIREKE